MRNKKETLIRLLTGIVIFGLIGVIIISTLYRQNVSAVATLALYTHENRDRTYYFVLDDRANLICTYGTRNHEDIRLNNFMKRFQKNSRTKISEQEFENILLMLDNLDSTKDDYSQEQFFGGLWVGLIYNDYVYKAIYWQNDSELFKEIIDEFLRLTPIQVDFSLFFAG